MPASHQVPKVPKSPKSQSPKSHKSQWPGNAMIGPGSDKCRKCRLGAATLVLAIGPITLKWTFSGLRWWQAWGVVKTMVVMMIMITMKRRMRLTIMLLACWEMNWRKRWQPVHLRLSPTSPSFAQTRPWWSWWWSWWSWDDQDDEDHDKMSTMMIMRMRMTIWHDSKCISEFIPTSFLHLFALEVLTIFILLDTAHNWFVNLNCPVPLQINISSLHWNQIALNFFTVSNVHHRQCHPLLTEVWHAL